MSELPPPEIPRAGLDALRRYARHDLVSGFLVFLIALPLCLGISLASGFPATAGLFTAIIGGVIAPLISNSELTIKGPAAGLIAIAIAAVTELGDGDPVRGYPLALGLCVVAGVVQIAFGLLRAGILSEFFPTAAVHGMLAAIGVIIASKQLHVMVGVIPTAHEPLALLAEVPNSIAHANPHVALIGLTSLVVLFGLPLLKNTRLARIPGPLLVLIGAVATAHALRLATPHEYSWSGVTHTVGPGFLVDVPDNLFDAVAPPDFSAVTTPSGIKYIIMFALVGSIESLLSSKAVDLLDPWRRKTNFDRDLVAVGIGNIITASVGGLPMISEIVRSSANISNGARTRYANVYHGLFLLGFLALAPSLIRMVPLAALGTMLVFTGCRLASPREFKYMARLGLDQLAIFLTTLLMTLITDLLVGIFSGIALKFALHAVRGLPLRATFKARIESTEEGDVVRLRVRDAAVFTNWIALRKQILAFEASSVIVDLSATRVTDHTVLAKLGELAREARHAGRTLEVVGLDRHHASSSDATAFRVRRGA
jgi:MFS superfamily sulfate permease-like transporter